MTTNNDKTAEQAVPPADDPNKAAEEEYACAGNRTASRLAEIRQAQETVGRMLRYAIANPVIKTTDELIANGVGILCRQPENYSGKDEVRLWKTYAELSKLIYPASDISIQIAEGLKDTVMSGDGGEVGVVAMSFSAKVRNWLGFNASTSKVVKRCYRDLTEITAYLVFFVGFYIVTQCYSALLSDTLTSSSRLLADFQVQQAAERLINNDTPTDQAARVRNATSLLATQLAASSQALVDLTKPLAHIPFLRLSFSTVDALDSCAAFPGTMKNLGDPSSLLGCIALEREYALSAYTVLSRYVLPLLLGFIGATAYVTRHTLFRLGTNSYVPSPRGMLTMRLCLGGLLGAISGIFISSDGKPIEGFNISLTLTALVMGYSVEVAFSLFDSAIERLKTWTRGLRETDGSANVPANVAVQAPVPADQGRT